MILCKFFLIMFLIFSLLSGCATVQAGPDPGCRGDCVILLHGLGRTERSMVDLAKSLSQSGYCTVNSGYPSMDKTVSAIAEQYLPPMIRQCRQAGVEKIHLVTHSLGGIVVRKFLQTHDLPAGSRIVMISPPNQGSRIVDVLKDNFLFEWIYGPAGQTLGTSPDSLPNSLAPVDAQIGVIAGNRSFNPLLSALVPGEDDGKVSVESAKLPEMQDFIVVEATHTFIMSDDEVIRQVKHFLARGRFSH
ncbi:MAG: esterase/lipase family protein [Thermodesulfobacteriota bacterium]